MKNKYPLFILLLSLLYSCRNELNDVDNIESAKCFLSQNEATTLDTYFNGTTLSFEEIINTSNSVIDYLESDSITKSNIPRSIENINCIKSQRNISKGGEESIAYVINFTNSQGYTILSADRRTDEIFAISSQGNINFNTLQEDYLDGKIPESVLLLLSNIENVINNQIVIYQNNEKALLESALDKISLDTKVDKEKRIKIQTDLAFVDVSTDEDTHIYNYYYTDWTTVETGSIKPLIKNKWSQNEPFNGNTPIVDGVHTPVGCVATAMAQIMSYWTFPTKYNWKMLNQYPYLSQYTSIPQEVKYEIARLMYDIGLAIDMNYSIEGSSANFRKAIEYFKNEDFSNPGTYGDYNTSRALRSIYSGHPVLIAGYDQIARKYLKIWFINILLKESLYGHCWVLDGVLRQGKTTTVTYDDIVVSSVTQYRTLFHCNYGWGGICDGYYASEIFNTNDGPVVKCIVEETEGDPYNFQYNIEAIYDISTN